MLLGGAKNPVASSVAYDFLPRLTASRVYFYEILLKMSEGETKHQRQNVVLIDTLTMILKTLTYIFHVHENLGHVFKHCFDFL